MGALTKIRDGYELAPNAQQYTGVEYLATLVGDAVYATPGFVDDFTTLKPDATVVSRTGANCLNGTHYMAFDLTTAKWIIRIIETDVEVADAVDTSAAAFGAIVKILYNR